MLKLFFFVACWTISIPKYVNGSDKETALINRLLHNYNPFARPVVNDSSTLNLEIILTLKQIINLDVRKQVLKTKLWLEYYWKDKNLIWNPVSLSLYFIFINDNSFYNVESVYFMPFLIFTSRKTMATSQVSEFRQMSKKVYAIIFFIRSFEKNNCVR